MVTPLEKALGWAQTSSNNIWRNYFYLRGVRAENRSLKAQIERMSLEQVRMSQDADQARRLQALLAFKEQFISQTMAAQVIGTSGSEQSRSVYIDKGEVDGLRPDTAVITANGVVGKVLLVYRSTALVLLISDHSSGVGAILEKSRIEGIVRGTPAGEVMLEKVMSDESVSVGEQVLTSGGDGIFPKGLLVGTVTKVTPGSDLFLNIHLRPAADLSKLEEVLVVTKIDQRQAEPEKTGAARAVDILAERLPTVPSKPENAEKGPAPETATPKIAIPKTVAPANSGLDAKPKAASSDALTSSGAPAARKPATSASSPVNSSGNPSGAASAAKPAASGIDATKLSKPVKATAEPKPQPAVEDIPH